MTALDRSLWAIGILALVLVIMYRTQIEWVYKNRDTLKQGQSIVDQFNSLKG